MPNALIHPVAPFPRKLEWLTDCVWPGRHAAEAPIQGALTYERPAVSASDTLQGGIRHDQLTRDLSLRANALVGDIEYKLEHDCLDSVELGETPPTKEAVAATVEFARKLAPHLSLTPRLKWSACTEETGGTSLVAQSLATERRLTFRIAPDGRSITAICIDEYMQSERVDVCIADRKRPRELAAWLNKQA